MHKNGFDDRLRNLEGLLWDLDNTLYRLDELLEEAFNIAVAHAAQDCGLSMPFDDAVTMARRSFAETGYSGRYFITEHGIDRDLLHHRFHDHLDETVIVKSVELQQSLDRQDLTHALITHGARTWAERVLQHLGLRSFFPDGHIFALEDYAFEKKHESRRPFTTALDRTGTAAARTVIIEDLAENLKIPHEMGLGTVWLHHGRPPAAVPDHVDFCCANALEFMQHLEALEESD